MDQLREDLVSVSLLQRLQGRLQTRLTQSPGLDEIAKFVRELRVAAGRIGTLIMNRSFQPGSTSRPVA